MLVTPQHQELQERHKKLVLKSMQFDMIIQKKDEQIQNLQSQITPLKNFVEQLQKIIEQLQLQQAESAKIIDRQNKQLQRLELIEHQYQQLQRLVYVRSSEKSSVTPGQLLLELNAEVIEACNINDGQKVESYTKHKAEKQKHPGCNQIPAHIPRTHLC